MKTLFNMIMVGSLAFALASCGKDNASSGGSSSSSNSNNGNTGISSSGSVYGSVSDLRSAFDRMGVHEGLNENDVVYHVGKDYGATSYYDYDIDFDFDFGVCFYFLWYASDDCNSGGSYYNQPNNSQLYNVINNGEYKVVRNRTSDTIDFDLAVGISGNGFDFDSTRFDRDATMYKAMLNLDGRSVKAVSMSEATIVLTNGNTVKGTFVEYLYNDDSIDGYILSTAFPVMANPILNTQNYQVTGVLNFAGSRTIRSISAVSHRFDWDWTTNKYRLSNAYPIRVSF